MTIDPRRPPQRRGYAMVAVLIFVILFLGLWSIAAQGVSSLLRVEQARARRVARDANYLPHRKALAQAAAAFQLGYPPTNPYECQVVVDGAAYALTFTIDPSGNDPTAWLVTTSQPADPGLPPLDPSQFPASPPMTSN
jgi:hypothetical protein